MSHKMTNADLESDGLTDVKKTSIASDVLGSYTGRARDPYETPVQDADDL